MKSLDSRDFTRDPPAYLDPHFVLLMRERLRNFQATGNLDWYKRAEDWMPGSRAPSADGDTNNT